MAIRSLSSSSCGPAPPANPETFAPYFFFRCFHLHVRSTVHRFDLSGACAVLNDHGRRIDGILLQLWSTPSCLLVIHVKKREAPGTLLSRFLAGAVLFHQPLQLLVEGSAASSSVDSTRSASTDGGWARLLVRLHQPCVRCQRRFRCEILTVTVHATTH